MGYQFPGFASVAFAGFTSVARSQESPRLKKGQNQVHSGADQSRIYSSARLKNNLSASTFSKCNSERLESVSARYLLKCRQDLRPLLNSLRFVESGNRENCPDGDCGASIGPLQISRQYHLDAWKHTSASAWSRCRDLNHAENTVIAYWLKYCPQAVEKQDFETLAKIHNGGPQGPLKEKTVYYWSKVSEYLKKQGLQTKETYTEKMPCCESAKQIPARQQGPKDVLARSQSALTPITNFMSSSRKEKNCSGKIPANSTTLKQQTPFVRSLKPKAVKQSACNSTAKEAQKKKRVKGSFEKPIELARRNCNNGVKDGSTYVVKHISCSSSMQANKRQCQTSHLQLNASLDCVALRNALHFGYWKFPQSFRREKAAVILQAFWRMYSVKGHYKRMQQAAVTIQKKWRRHVYFISKREHILLKSHQNCFPARLDEGKGATSCLRLDSAEVKEEQGCDVRLLGSTCDLLYKGDLSPNQEDELLTELMSLLTRGKDTSDTVESCHSFRFPRFEEDTEACTPKFNQDQRIWHTGSQDSSKEIGRVEEKEDRLSSSSLVLGFPDPSTWKMENEIITEFTKLSPSYMDGVFQEDGLVDHQSCNNHLVSESITEKEKVEFSAISKHSIKDTTDQRLASKKNQRLDWNDINDKEVDEIFAVIVSLMEKHEKKDLMHNLSLQDLENHSCIIGSNVLNSEPESVNRISADTPLPTDLSPVLAIESQNSHNIITKKAVVSESKWQCSALHEEEKQMETHNTRIKDKVRVGQTSYSSFQDWQIVSMKSERDERTNEGCKGQTRLSKTSKATNRIQSKKEHFCPNVNSNIEDNLSFCSPQESLLCSVTTASDIQPKHLRSSNNHRNSRPMDILCKENLSSWDPSSDILYSDCLLETADARSSAVYAKVIFQCMNLSLNQIEQEKPILSNSLSNDRIAKSLRHTWDDLTLLSNGDLLVEADEVCIRGKNNCHPSKEGFSCSSIIADHDSAITVLTDLGMLWHKHNVDLLTRTLKYKNLQAIVQNQQVHQDPLLKCAHSGDEGPHLERGIHSLERFQMKLKNGKKDRELVQQQRDIIYTNISAKCDKQGRYQLYAKWKIHKGWTGRLKKIVYELLWIDPQRYQESADLVIQYL